jgi:hypothetical protein
MLSRDRVTIDGFIGRYSLQITITHRLVFSLTVVTALLGNVFNSGRSSATRRLAGISRQPPTLTAISGLSPRVRVTLRLAVYRQLVRLEAKPLEFTTSIFFSTEHLLS